MTPGPIPVAVRALASGTADSGPRYKVVGSPLSLRGLAARHGYPRRRAARAELPLRGWRLGKERI